MMPIPLDDVDKGNQCDEKKEQCVEDNETSVHRKKKNFQRPFRMAKIVVVVLFVSTILNLVFMWWMGFYASSFMNYGPSPTLVVPFTHVVIDTWTKYCIAAAVRMYNDFIAIICSDLIGPWLFNHLMSQSVTYIGTPRIQSYLIAQVYFFLSSFMDIPFIGFSMTQIDLFIIGHLGGILAGICSLFYIMSQKED